MIEPIEPQNEQERLKKLYEYNILDTLPEKNYDDITKLAAYICNTPIALVSLIDNDRQWFKSRYGLDAEETPRNVAFCAHAILSDDLFIVEDSFKDERFHDNPLAVNAPFVRFYAGAPLITSEGLAIGTLCVIDNKPNKLSQEQKDALASLGRQVVALLDLRLTVKELQDLVHEKNETETKLKEAIDSSIQANKAKSRFLALMSHEIRTPMNGVIGMLSMLAQTRLTPEQEEYINIIKVSGDNLVTIINDILDISKIEAGKLELENSPFSPAEVIAETVRLYSGTALDRNLYLKAEVDENLPKLVYGDPTRFKQILNNLVSNSLKFTHSGGVTIKTISREESENRFFVDISVADTGIGISEEKIRNLFNTFTQADSTINRKYGGSGLGLSICKSLVELMKGKIEVESFEGQGTKFTVSLVFPAAKDILKDADRELQSEVISIHSGIAQNLKILTAEDNTINQKLIKSMLKKIGCVSDMVENGKQAINAALKNEYDIILMDVMMPELDGIEAARLILSNTKQSIPPVIIAMTANASEDDKIICFNAGMSDFLCKPYRVVELSVLLKKWGEYVLNKKGRL